MLFISEPHNQKKFFTISFISIIFFLENTEHDHSYFRFLLF